VKQLHKMAEYAESNIKEALKSKMMSMTSKRMIDVDKLINAEIGKIKRINGLIESRSK
jgi:hypothetical protein